MRLTQKPNVDCSLKNFCQQVFRSHQIIAKRGNSSFCKQGFFQSFFCTVGCKNQRERAMVFSEVVCSRRNTMNIRSSYRRKASSTRTVGHTIPSEKTVCM